MKRLATLVLAAGFSVSSLLALGQGASATPFSDVPANHWAYQAIQSLAADGLVEGYPDGKFKGDRPLTRYEMAVIIATARTFQNIDCAVQPVGDASNVTSRKVSRGTAANVSAQRA